jgi:DNA-binding transcriptional LysR family regulator
MELVHLRALIAVADAGGFSRAARLAASTQPTLSRQVLQLERELGRSLFDRLGKKVVLTDFGGDILSRARALVGEADSLAAAGRGASGRIAGLLRVGAADSVLLGRLPRLLQGYRRRYPEVRVHVRMGSSLEIVSWVREGQCDVGLCMLPGRLPGLRLLPLWEDPFVALVPSRHPLGKKPTVTLEEFARERQIAIRTETLSHQVLASAFQTGGLTLVPDMIFDTFHLIVEFIAAGLGVGIATEMSVLESPRRNRVTKLDLGAVSSLPRHLGVVLHADKSPEGALAALLEELGPD